MSETVTTRQQVRHGELRSVLWAVRRTREALAAGNLRAAVRAHTEAAQSLHFLLGLLKWTTATAGLSRVVWRLGGVIEDALPTERPPVLPDEDRLVALIRDGIEVLRTRDGIDIDDGHATERANNIAGQILAEAQAAALSD